MNLLYYIDFQSTNYNRQRLVFLDNLKGSENCFKLVCFENYVCLEMSIVNSLHLKTISEGTLVYQLQIYSIIGVGDVISALNKSHCCQFSLEGTLVFQLYIYSISEVIIGVGFVISAHDKSMYKHPAFYLCFKFPSWLGQGFIIVIQVV